MTLDYIYQVLDRRRIALESAKSQAFNRGDLEILEKLDIELIETTNTLSRVSKIKEHEEVIKDYEAKKVDPKLDE